MSKKQSNTTKRTNYDEYKYDESLRAEENIKSAVISELRGGYRALLENQKRTIEALIATGDLLQQSLSALRVYRTAILESTNRDIARAAESHCVANCNTGHGWDSERGWHGPDRITVNMNYVVAKDKRS